jgi:hypothetical protein
VLLLALGMGGVTVLFTVVDGVLLEPLDSPRAIGTLSIVAAHDPIVVRSRQHR